MTRMLIVKTGVGGAVIAQPSTITLIIHMSHLFKHGTLEEPEWISFIQISVALETICSICSFSCDALAFDRQMFALPDTSSCLTL